MKFDIDCLRKEQQSGMGCVCLYPKSELIVPKFNKSELKVLFFKELPKSSVEYLIN